MTRPPAEVVEQREYEYMAHLRYKLRKIAQIAQNRSLVPPEAALCLACVTAAPTECRERGLGPRSGSVLCAARYTFSQRGRTLGGWAGGPSSRSTTPR